MIKFRIVEKRLEGAENIIRYYIQERKHILFIPYWESFTDDTSIFGSTKYFYNINDAKEFIKKYHKGSRRVVYKE